MASEVEARKTAGKRQGNGAKKKEVAAEKARLKASCIEKVYHSEYLMREIISNVVDLKTRSKLEASSRRLYYLSRSTKFKFPLESDHLRLLLRHWHNPVLTITVGTIECDTECLSFNTRHGNFNHQPQEMLTLLDNIVDRVNPDTIGRLQIGGVMREDYVRGFRGHLLVCTADLLQYLEKFKYLWSISFEHVHFDDGAAEYLLSEECTFHERLEEITFNKVTFDSRPVTRNVLERLFTTKLKKFSLNIFGINSQGNAFLETLETKKHKLEQLDIYLDEDAFGPQTATVEEGFTFMRRCSEATNDLRVHFWHVAFSDDLKLFGVAKDICKLSNITELNLDLFACKAETLRSAAFVCKNISLLNLKSFSIGGFRDKNRRKEELIINCLISGVRKCQTLEAFGLTRVPKRDKLFLKLIEVLPPTLVKLELASAPFNDEMMITALTRFRDLRDLSMKQMSRVTPEVVDFVMKEMPELRTLVIEIVCAAPAIHLPTNLSPHPKLRHLEFCLKYKPAERDVKMLKQYFRGVLVEHILLYPNKNRKAFLVTCDWPLTTAPPPSSGLATLKLEDLVPSKHHRRRRSRLSVEWK